MWCFVYQYDDIWMIACVSKKGCVPDDMFNEVGTNENQAEYPIFRQNPHVDEFIINRRDLAWKTWKTWF